MRKFKLIKWYFTHRTTNMGLSVQGSKYYSSILTTVPNLWMLTGSKTVWIWVACLFVLQFVYFIQWNGKHLEPFAGLFSLLHSGNIWHDICVTISKCVQRRFCNLFYLSFLLPGELFHKLLVKRISSKQTRVGDFFSLFTSCFKEPLNLWLCSCT